jgi:hypothetical protein
VIENEKIANYQAVVPSTWNVGPRDVNGQAGPCEAALEGHALHDPEQPVEILCTIHSFDPCIACAVHPAPECRDAQAAKRDIPVALSPSLVTTAYCARTAPASVPLRPILASSELTTKHSHKWLDGVSDALAYALRWLRDVRPLRPSDHTLAPTPSGGYAPSLRSPWRAADEKGEELFRVKVL